MLMETETGQDLLRFEDQGLEAKQLNQVNKSVNK